MVDSGEVLVEARRVFGEKAQVQYGTTGGRGWSSAGATLDFEDFMSANELTVWGDAPLERLLTCLRALPAVTP